MRSGYQVPVRGDWSEEELSRFMALMSRAGSSFVPHAGQCSILRIRSRLKIVLCGRRFGKSQLAAYEIVRHLLEMARVGFPRTRVRVTAPQYVHIQEVMNYLRRICEALGLRYERVSDPKDYHFRVNGVRIEPKPTENPLALRGAGVSLLVVDECSEVQGTVFNEALFPTVSDLQGEVLLLGTAKGVNWVIDLGRNLGLKFHMDSSPLESVYMDRVGTHASCFQAPTWLNPFIDREYLEFQRQALEPDIYDQEYGALIVGRFGRAFIHFPVRVEHFDPVLLQHGIGVSGLDYGSGAPSAFYPVVKCLDGVYRVLGEIYKAHLTPSMLKEEVDRLYRDLGISYDIVPDPTLFNDIGVENVASQLMAQGLSLVQIGAKSRSRVSGWTTIRELLVPSPRCRIEVHGSCRMLLHEFASARPSRDDLNDIGGSDHALDALRYAVMYLHHEHPDAPYPPGSYAEWKHRRAQLRAESELYGDADRAWITY